MIIILICFPYNNQNYQSISSQQTSLNETKNNITQYGSISDLFNDTNNNYNIN